MDGYTAHSKYSILNSYEVPMIFKTKVVRIRGSITLQEVMEERSWDKVSTKELKKS